MSLQINCANQALPISTDVQVTVNKPQTEQTVNLTIPAFVTSTGDRLPGAERLSYYTNLTSVGTDWGTSSEPYKAATNFFAQTIRAQQMAVAQAYNTPQPAYLITDQLGDIADFQSVTDGAFLINVDGIDTQISGLDFSAATSYADIATVISAATALLTVEVYNSVQILFKTISTGDTSSISVLSAPATGTDISGVLYLNGQDGTVENGYTPTGIAGELDIIQQVASCSGQYIYGWQLDITYRNTSDQLAASAWAEANDVILGLISSTPLSYEASSTTDIGYILRNGTNPTRTFITYNPNEDYYDAFSILARMLGVDYTAPGSALTAKFKSLPGIPTVPLNTTQLTTLEAKSYNIYTATGKSALVFREGGMVNTNWFIDDRINLDNFQQDVGVAIENTFIKNGKVKYDAKGQTLLHSTISTVCDQYVSNGSFDSYVVIDTPLQNISDSQKQQRIGPPFTVDAILSGAIHRLAIQVNAYN